MRGRGVTGPPRASTLTQTLSHARQAGLSPADLRQFFKGALVSPVLTAHPTEVRRKSTMDREMEIAALLDRRERVQLTPEEIEASDEQLRRAVLSLPAPLADVSEELRTLAGRSPDPSPHRSGEPYRLAVSGIYARLTATAAKLEVETTRPPVGKAEPYASVKEFKADLDVLDRSLIANNSTVISRGRLRHLRRAVDCFGFHLARLDIRQNSAVHERTVAELFDAAISGMSYLALNEEARINLLLSELRSARPLSSAFVKYSEETLGELAVFRAAADAHAKFGADVIPQCIISMCKGVSDMLEVAGLL